MTERLPASFKGYIGKPAPRTGAIREFPLPSESANVALMAKTSVKTAQTAPKSHSREPQIPAMTLRLTHAGIHNKNAPGE
jgi:hypothetical protein